MKLTSSAQVLKATLLDSWLGSTAMRILQAVQERREDLLKRHGANSLLQLLERKGIN